MELKNTFGQSISQRTVSENREDRQAASISCSLLKGDRSLLKRRRLRLCSLKAINTSIKSSSILISPDMFSVQRWEGLKVQNEITIGDFWVTPRSVLLLQKDLTSRAREHCKTVVRKHSLQHFKEEFT